MSDRVEILKQFLAGKPGDPFLQHALALEYIKVDRDKDAVAIFENILQHDPSYVGSYYHLAKTLERLGERDQAIGIYEKGMEEAKNSGDRHALSELQAAYEDLIY